MNIHGKNRKTTGTRPSRHRRQRGSVLLLVAAVLILVFVLGLMVMEIARLDRASTANLSRAQEMDMVFNATVDKVESLLKEDLGIDDQDDSDPSNDVFFTGGAETYDYPGDMDRWLAPFEPDSAGQLSSMDKNTHIVGGANADADGDGINDAKWQTAPIPLLNGVSYRVAVRTVDLSAMANMNVALSQVDSGGAYDPDTNASTTDAARWRNPSDLDLGGVAYWASQMGPSPYTNAMIEMQALIQERFSATPGPPFPSTYIPTPDSDGNDWRRWYWENVARKYGNYGSFYKIGAADQLEMSYRNGLNKSGLGTALRDEHMPRTLRAEDTGGTALPNEVIFSEMNEISGVSNQTQYYQNNPKLYFTAYSGANIYAPAIDSSETGFLSSLSPVVKRDVNSLTDTELRDEIEKALSPGSNFVAPNGFASPAEYAAALAASLRDYYDSDSELTVVQDTGGTNRFGFEALPFISEVYAQQQYKATAEDDDGDGTWDVTWDAQGTPGYAIEIRNPFRKPVKLDNVELIVGGTNLGAVSSLAGAPLELGVDEVLIVYRDSTGGDAADDDVAALIASSTPAAIPVDASDAWPATAGAVTVSLQVAYTGAASGTYEYSKSNTALGMPASFTATDASDVTDKTGYRQTFAIGNGDKLNILTVKPSEFNSGMVFTEDDRDTTLDQLTGATPKSGGVTGKIASANLSSEQIVFFDNDIDDKLTHVGDIALVASLPLDGTNTVGEAWGAAGSADAFRLDFASPQLVGSGIYAVPHAVLLMDRLTTLSPLEDGEDNDGQGGADNPEELLLHGTVNLNTISKDLMLRLLPVPDNTVRTQLADAIIAYRDADERPNIAGLRTEKGIAMLGELMNFDRTPDQNNPSIAFLANGIEDRLLNGTVIDFLSNPSNDPTTDGIDNDGDTMVDEPDEANVGDNIADDREEKTMLARWLAQVASTRSDYFVSFVRVQGVNPFDNAIQTERRAIIIYDRSSVTDGSKDVSVVGMLEY